MRQRSQCRQSASRVWSDENSIPTVLVAAPVLSSLSVVIFSLVAAMLAVTEIKGARAVWMKAAVVDMEEVVVDAS